MEGTLQLADCPLLVLSCDAYCDLWEPFFGLLRLHWPDCPMEIFLGAETVEFNAPNVRTLLSGPGKDWSQRVIWYLEQIEKPFVLVMLEDFFLRQRVSNSMIGECLEFANMNRAIQVRLIPRPKPTVPISGEKLIGVSEKGSPYRLCTQAAIWNRLSLIGLLHEGESIWDFERNGNVRASSYDTGFYSVWRQALPYGGFLSHHVIEKGCWLGHQKWIFGRRNLGCDFSKRATLPLVQTVIYQFANGMNRALDIFPWKLKAGIKRSIRLFLGPLLGGSFERLSKSAADQKRS